MNNLEQLATRLDNLQTSLSLIKYDLENELKKQETPKYELSDLMREIIEQVLDRFIDEHVFDRLDGSYNYNLREGAFDIDVTLDLNDIVCDQISSSHQLANDFVDELVRELNSLKQQDETTEQRDEQHQDCLE